MGELTVFEKHQLKIARDTLKMNSVFANIMSGPTKEEAKKIIAYLENKILHTAIYGKGEKNEQNQ